MKFLSLKPANTGTFKSLSASWFCVQVEFLNDQVSDLLPKLLLFTIQGRNCMYGANELAALCKICKVLQIPFH